MKRDHLKSVAFETINQSPTNKSVSKQTFSFSKTPRFHLPKPNCPLSTYAGVPISHKNSGTSMGFGKKYDFTKSIENNPSAAKYNFTSIFELNKNKRKGCTIGNSREKIKFETYIDQQKIHNPGIGRYDIQAEIMVRTSRAPSFSMALRTKPTDLTRTIESQNKNPSPAHYENNPEMSKTLYASNFKTTSYSQSKSKRFLKADNLVPGPGEYENPTNLSSIGKYLLSANKGGTYAKFNQSKRTTKFDEYTNQAKKKPGPGSYRSISEFGVYDDENHMKTSIKK